MQLAKVKKKGSLPPEEEMKRTEIENGAGDPSPGKGALKNSKLVITIVISAVLTVIAAVIIYILVIQ